MKFILTDDVNSYECVETIKAACPDLIVSVSMNQVIKKRKHSPLLKHRDALVIDTGKLNIMTMVSKMSLIIDKEIKKKYGS